MKILITGANGMVAKATIDYCRSIGDEVVALTRQELDISDKQAVFEFIRARKTCSRFKLRGLYRC